MHTELTAASNNEAYSPAIRATLKLGIGLLNKYYSLTDNSEIYRIAMGKLIISTTQCCLIILLSFLVLHPKHKLRYFEKQGWDETWIKTAEEIVREEFKKNYATYAIQKEKKVTHSSKKVRCGLINSLNITTTYKFTAVLARW